eukprot:CAMPEP_0174863086 /NCGR_PEP_ID=MMETSP1114-20130205/55523_1 /TAXON_ID=312471 /ORGANISM="Neobodo designis, Strain CCAP 1951/1" /LENGTH=538 /DNA_ID=CAMNT_0016098147 /DNA_START=135 /DNA_END=1747 /DNA_ORIENTATION=+
MSTEVKSGAEDERFASDLVREECSRAGRDHVPGPVLLQGHRHPVQQNHSTGGLVMGVIQVTCPACKGIISIIDLEQQNLLVCDSCQRVLQQRNDDDARSTLYDVVDFTVKTGASGPVKVYSSQDKQRLRARLTAFYHAFDLDVSNWRINQLVESTITEEQMFTKLVSRYPESQQVFSGHAPPCSPAAARPRSSPNSCATSASTAPTNGYSVPTGGTGPVKEYTGELHRKLKQRLDAFYRVHNPAEADVKVAKALTMKATEEALFSMLALLYAVAVSPPRLGYDPEDFTVPTGGSGSIKKYTNQLKACLRVRLTAFYHAHNPEQAEPAEKVAEALGMAATEEQLFSKLVSLYPGSPPVRRAWPPIAQSAASSPVPKSAPAAAASPGAAGPRPYDPDDFTAPTGASGPVNEYTGQAKVRLRTRLAAFFNVYEPLETTAVKQGIDTFMETAVTETEIFMRLARQVPESQAVFSGQAPFPRSRPGSLVRRAEAMIRHYDPDAVTLLLEERYRGRPGELLLELRERHGPEPLYFGGPLPEASP